MTSASEGEKGTSVLLVEDEPLICDMVAEALKEQGFAVEAVANADDALQLLMAGKRVDILFTDVNLPGGMDGETLAQRVRELKPNLPVMYTSGRRTVIEQLSPVEGSMFIPKPYNPYEIGRLLDYLVAAKGIIEASHARPATRSFDQLKVRAS
jgi:DNA-binding response OmpR family regulator